MSRRNDNQFRQCFESARCSSYGNDISDYDALKHRLVWILFGEEDERIGCSRLALLKRFLESVFKVPKMYLDSGLEPLLDRVEYADLCRCMLLCSLPIPLDLCPFCWENATESESELRNRHPVSLIRNVRADGTSFYRKRVFSLKEHSWVGTLSGLLLDDSGPCSWTTNLELFSLRQWQQFRLDLNGISASTLLLFCSVGSVEYPLEDDEDPFSYLCPKMMCNLQGFNQRMITDLERLWNPQEDGMSVGQEGLMQAMYRVQMSVCWGNIPYVLYPHMEHSYNKLPPGAFMDIKEDPEGGLELNLDRFRISSTIRQGQKNEYIYVGDRRYQAFDVDFVSICNAYEAVFEVPFTSIYVLEGGIQHQVKALLALGCLLRDVNRLCHGFVDPERVFPGLFAYLQKRISKVIRVEDGAPLLLFSMGRSIQETFLRIRLMFRFLLGEAVFGIVDGIGRLTALSYCWQGLIPEQGLKSSLDAKSRRIADAPTYSMLSSPCAVSLLMCGKKYQTMDIGPIRQETFDFVKRYSLATQSSLESAQGLSMQSVLVTLLREYQGGFPFDDAKYRVFFANLRVEYPRLSDDVSDLFESVVEHETPSQREKWYRNRIRYYIYHTIGLSPQTDISTAWGSGGSSRELLEKKKYIWTVDVMKVNRKLMVIDVLVRFLMLIGVVRLVDIPLSQNAYALEFLDLLITLVENNGKTWQKEGGDVRSGMDYVTNPLREFDVVENRLLENAGEVLRLDEALTAPENLEALSREDPNERRGLMVGVCDCMYVILHLFCCLC